MSLDLTTFRSLSNALREARWQAPRRKPMMDELAALSRQYHADVRTLGKDAALRTPTRKRMNLLRATLRQIAKPIAPAREAVQAEHARLLAAVIAEDGPVPQGQERARRQRAADSLVQSMAEGLAQVDKTAHERKPKRS